jgi:hypothetical protein
VRGECRAQISDVGLDCEPIYELDGAYAARTSERLPSKHPAERLAQLRVGREIAMRRPRMVTRESG